MINMSSCFDVTEVTIFKIAYRIMQLQLSTYYIVAERVDLEVI